MMLALPAPTCPPAYFVINYLERMYSGKVFVVWRQQENRFPSGEGVARAQF